MPEPAGSDRQRYAACLAYIALAAASLLLVRLSQRHGAYDFDPVVVTLGAEVIKLLVTGAALYATGQALPAVGASAPFAVPGLFYFIDNNIQYALLLNFSAVVTSVRVLPCFLFK